MIAAASPCGAQPVHEEVLTLRTLSLGGHGVALLTYVSPILGGTSKTEAYLTQPTLTAQLALAGGRLNAHAAVSLEPLTLERGELGAGMYGEGYVDRRHPHTYAHELMLSALSDIGPVTASLALGRGFVPFGTDDPMMRPFVKFPVNHHLGQILERLVTIGGAGSDRFLVEAALFSGLEPLDPNDRGSLDRFGDSWAVRVTLFPLRGVELQTSFADVESPEMPRSEGWDHRKWSASARYDRTHALGSIYALAEWKRTTELNDGRDVFSFGSILAEAELEHRGWRPAVRIERTERPEEERTFNPFRSPWPHPQKSVLGITRWTIVAARVQHDSQWNVLRLAPFVEGSYTHVVETARGPFDPVIFYGDSSIWTLNIGARIGAGSHRRMGRYGVAAEPATLTHNH